MIQHYTLIDCLSICCHGTSFPSLIAAKNYAHELQKQYGLCQWFNIGAYIDGKYIEVYKSWSKEDEDKFRLARNNRQKSIWRSI